MSTSLVLRESADITKITGLVDPGSGEVVDLASCDREQIAAWLIAVRDWETQLRIAKNVANECFLDLTRREIDLSVKVNGYRVAVPAADSQWIANPEALRKTLDDLVNANRLSVEAADAICRARWTDPCPKCQHSEPIVGQYDVNRPAINKIKTSNPEMWARLEACGSWVETARPFSVTKTR